MNLKINFLLKYSVVLILLFHFSKSGNAQKTLGTTQLDEANTDDGFTLFSPIGTQETYLINNSGDVVNKWTSDYRPGIDVELSASGKLYRTCRLDIDGYNHAGKGGRIEIRNWNDSLEWFAEICFPDSCLHHDISLLPNGNILALVATKKQLPEILEAGKDTTKMRAKVIWTESIIEIKPLANNDYKIVWSWNIWDHFIQDKFPSKSNYGVVKEHPGKYNINFSTGIETSGDLFHINSIDYNAENDMILLSVKNINEIWVIDHSTTTNQAQTSTGGKQKSGGELIYRWGNSNTYGQIGDSLIDNQHDACWVMKNGKWTGQISVFNNNVKAKNSCMVVIKPSINKKKSTFLKNKKGQFLETEVQVNFCPEKVFGGRQCSFQVLPNGNYLLGYSAKGEIIEYNSEGDIVWRYVSPYSNKGVLKEGDPINANTYFKAKKYDSKLIQKFQN